MKKPGYTIDQSLSKWLECTQMLKQFLPNQQVDDAPSGSKLISIMEIFKIASSEGNERE